MDSLSDNSKKQSVIFVEGEASGDVLCCAEGLSFWGGVDPETGRIIDVHHPDCGASVAGKILQMPTSRGSCSGSGVLLELSLNGLAPAALVFKEPEEILTLGALVADRVFGKPLPTLSLSAKDYARLAESKAASISGSKLIVGSQELSLDVTKLGDIELTDEDQSLLSGTSGPAAKMAMDIICLMASVAGVRQLTNVTRGHIDGCILAHSANLIFAEKLADLGAKVVVPTTINAISVDRENWTSQNISADFGGRASRLSDAYVRMGARPTFTCAPYLLDDAPVEGETIGWSESNAVIYANTVLGARSPKHPDYLDLFIAMTGRAPASGVYTQEGRVARKVIAVSPPVTLGLHDDLFWPLLGWLAGRESPDHIPLLTGIEHLHPTKDDLKALCAAFGTTSGAPMLHIAGHTPEGAQSPHADAERRFIGMADFVCAWTELNQGEMTVDLVAIGSPHASINEVRRVADLLGDNQCNPATKMIITIGREVLNQTKSEGLVDRLEKAGVRLIPDLCWCSITEPVFPPEAKGLFTNSGKYAHYAHGLTGRHSRIGSLKECVDAAVSGQAPEKRPAWLDG